MPTLSGRRALLRRHAVTLLALLLALGCYVLVYFSTVSYARSDPYLTPLVAQAIVTQGTIRLDAYKDAFDPPLDDPERWGWIIQEDGHLYHYFPLGAALFSVPPVAAATLLGYNMVVPATTVTMHRLISGLIVALTFLAIFGIVRTLLDPASSFGVSLISVLGSPLTSTGGTAVWSMSVSTLLVSLALWLLVRYEYGGSRTPHPLWLGGLLVAAAIARPTAGLFAALALLYLLVRDRAALIRCGAAISLLGGGYLAFNYVEFGQWLPPYFDAAGRIAAVSHRNTLWEGLSGSLLSPGRGLFTFSPAFGLPFLALPPLARRVARQPLFWLALLWVGLHLWLVVSATRWWGGHAYGPRLMMDVVPALVLLTALLWRALQQHGSRHARWLVAALYLLLGAWGIWVHSYQGLYNPQTAAWNASPPDVDRHPETLFDWRFPQFLASSEQLCERTAQFAAETLVEDSTPIETYRLGSPIRYNLSLNNALLPGWSLPEVGYRWSQCGTARVLFRLPPDPLPDGFYDLTVTLATLGPQPTTIRLNDTLIATPYFETPLEQPTTHTIRFDGSLLRPGATNELEFVLPNARRPTDDPRGDPRRLGLALVSLTIAPHRE